MSISPIRHSTLVAKPAAPAAAPSLADIKKAYDTDVEKHGYKLIDPDKDKAFQGTRAYKIYDSTMGGPLVTDGDHLVYRGKAGNYLVMTYPEDAGRGDGLWAFDKTGNKLLAHGTGRDGKLHWDAPRKKA